MAEFPRLAATALDAPDCRALAEFYRELLGLRYRDGDDMPPAGQADTADWLVLIDDHGRAVVAIQHKPDLQPSTWPSEDVPMQMHMDFTVETVEELQRQRARAELLGARVLLDRTDDPGEPLYVLADPAGHPFCIFVSPANPAPAPTERDLAAQLFNETWTLMDQESRTADEDDRMIHSAHASRLHWDNVGSDQERAIGEWQISRVYTLLGEGKRAVHHAERALRYAQSPDVAVWVQASAYEGLARAHHACGDDQSARQAKASGLELLSQVDDDDERALLTSDFDNLPC